MKKNDLEKKEVKETSKCETLKFIQHKFDVSEE